MDRIRNASPLPRLARSAARARSSRLLRWRFNWFPAYRGTGARLTYIDRSCREVRVRLPLSWRTRNYVGTIFGGSMYGAVDPVYMIMLIKLRGPEYVVWDKAATIRFRRPGRETLHATFPARGSGAGRHPLRARDRAFRRAHLPRGARE